MDKVTQAFVDVYRSRISDGIAAASGAREPDGGPLVESVIACLSQRLQPFSPRVFVVDFHEQREAWGLPVDENSTTAINRYTESFGTETIERWFEVYPVLADLMDIVVDSSVAHVAEIAQRWHADRDELIAQGFVAADDELAGIEHMGSDAHKHGKMVAAIRFTNGSRLMYKPRNLGTEEYTRICMERISDTVGIDLGVCAPESFDGGEYGWQREVVRRGAQSEDEVRAYYSRFGAVCALLSALGATDLHYDNVIAAGDHPVMLDLETVLRAAPHLASQDLSTGIANRVKTSLASTLLLPQRMASGPYSVLLGGLGVAYEQQSSRTDFIMVNRDTDAIDIAKRTWPFVHKDNILTGPDGEPTDVLDYRAEFVEGMRSGTRAVAAHAEELISLLDSRPVVVRQIFRATAVYARILEAATHPDNLQNHADFERIITMLGPPPLCDRTIVHPFIADSEKEALLRGDIPYFVTDSDDIRAWSEGNLSAPFADLSPRDRAAYGLRKVDERALQFEELLIEEGLAEVRATRREHVPDYVPSPSGAWGEQFLGTEGIDADAVLEHLMTVSIATDGVDGTERGWVCGAFGPNIGTFDPGTHTAFHDAGGILLPFERTAAMRGEDGALQSAQEARRGVVSLNRLFREKMATLPLSPASGTLSVEYVLGHAQSRLPLARWDETWLDDAELAPADDAMAGLPGAGLLLAGFPETPQDLLRAIAERLPETTAGPWDMAHGNLGLTWARHRLATALGDDAEVQRITADFDAALASAPESLTSAWCAGHAGVCMAAAEISQEDALVRKHAEQAATLPAVDEPIDLSLCHGASGVVQSLVHLAQSRGESWPLELAVDYWQRVAKHARDAGYVTGDTARQGLLGYFLGWAGIADTGLLLTAALDGDRVWVPLSFMSSSRPVTGQAP